VAAHAQYNGFLVAIHCANHRLALCVKDANETAECAKWVSTHDNFMAHAYSLCGKSPANTALFSEFCQELKLLHLKPKQAHKVRWSGRFFQVQQTYECLPAWRELFERIADNTNANKSNREKATSLLSHANRYAFVIQNAYLMDMCELLHRLTCSLQEQDICFQRYGSSCRACQLKRPFRLPC
jgi:hypothetical protein